MKITTQKQFTPVTIALESQDEVDILRSVCGAVVSNGRYGDVISRIYYALAKYVDKESLVIGTLSIK